MSILPKKIYIDKSFITEEEFNSGIASIPQNDRVDLDKYIQKQLDNGIIVPDITIPNPTFTNYISLQLFSSNGISFDTSDVFTTPSYLIGSFLREVKIYRFDKVVGAGKPLIIGYLNSAPTGAGSYSQAFNISQAQTLIYTPNIPITQEKHDRFFFSCNTENDEYVVATLTFEKTQ